MNDMGAVIIAKSDQLNSDDLISGPITITITSVAIRPGTEQPVSIFYDGDGGKPYKCCKSMARVMVECWGPDANNYVGRSMMLYRDPKVLWGGMAVGGIRISHMSHLDRATTMALTATKGNKRPFTVQPLAEVSTNGGSGNAAPKKQTLSEWLTKVGSALADAQTDEAVTVIVSSDEVQKALTGLKNGALAMLQEQIAKAQKRTALSTTNESTDSSAHGDTAFLDEATGDPDPLDAQNIADVKTEVARYGLQHATQAKAGTNARHNSAVALLSDAGKREIAAAVDARLAELRMAG